jgi:LPXTG-site transpeptidase (sortase) family protein
MMFKHLFSSLPMLRLHRSLWVAAVLAFVFAGRAAANGDAASIIIPSLDLTAPIVNLPLDNSIGTWNTSQLGDNVGHFEHTPWLGQNGNIVLGGHATDEDGTPSIFYELPGVSVGDLITIRVGDQDVNYLVRRIRSVAINDLSILYPSRGETLTLLTCSGFNPETRTYERRLAIVAERVG